MTHIEIHVTGASAIAKCYGRLTGGMRGVTVQVFFNAEWDGLTKTGYARAGSVEKPVVLDGTGKGTVPWECMVVGERLNIGIDGVNANGKLRIPTIWAFIDEVKESVDGSNASEAEPPPTPSEVEQITAVAQEASRKAASAEAKADDVVARANAGEFDGADGYTPVKNVDYFDGKDGYTPVKNVDYFDGKDGYTPVKGVDYSDGTDGVSPTVNVADIEGGHRVTITDVEGSKSFDVNDGGGSGGGAVESVNGKTGAVVLNANNVGALPANTPLFDGNYNSLINKPTIPEAYDDTAVRQLIGQKYTKPSEGIPASDIADGVIPPAVTDEHINELIDSKMPTIPDKLPNPNALTFTGAATGSYDGSQPLSIEIPQGGGGGGEYSIVADFTLSESVSSFRIPDFNPNDFQDIIILIENPVSTINNGSLFANWKSTNGSIIAVSKSASSCTVFIEMHKVGVEYTFSAVSTGTPLHASKDMCVFATLQSFYDYLSFRTDGRQYLMAGMEIKVYAR